MIGFSELQRDQYLYCGATVKNTATDAGITPVTSSAALVVPDVES